VRRPVKITSVIPRFAGKACKKLPLKVCNAAPFKKLSILPAYGRLLNFKAAGQGCNMIIAW
jgi:hypothetical protein